ncbi:MAG: hypothetical protein ACOYN6_05670 [Ignavibacteria bacterium]
MKNIKAKNTVKNNNYKLLMDLGDEEKLELISLLADSLKKFNDDKRLTLGKTFGAFISSKSSKELITTSRKSRTFTRKVESF